MTSATPQTNDEILQFPQLFPIKLVGLTTEYFQTIVTDIAREHFDDFDESTIEIDYSRTRKYMSVTITVNAKSREQLDNMYRACTSNPVYKVVL